MARTLELTSVALADQVERLTRRIQQLDKLHSRVLSEAAPTRSDFVWIDESPLMDPHYDAQTLWEYYDAQMKDDLSHPSSPVPDDPLALVNIHHVIALLAASREFWGLISSFREALEPMMCAAGVSVTLK